MLLDEIAFEDKGLQLGVDDDPLDVLDLADEPFDPRSMPGGILEVASNAVAKAERLAGTYGVLNVTYRKAYIEDTRLDTASCDCVISNGVINLAPDKAAVFSEAARLVKRGGRLAIADIVTDIPLPENVVCNADLWAACIGGAAQRESYRRAIESAGFEIVAVEDNPGYHFISERAQKATAKWGVKSVSILARRI